MSVKRIASMSLDGKFTDLTQPGTSGKEVLTESQLAAYLKMPYQDFDGIAVPAERVEEAKHALEHTLQNSDPSLTVGEILFDYWGTVETSAASVPAEIMGQICKCYVRAVKEMGLIGLLDSYMLH